MAVARMFPSDPPESVCRPRGHSVRASTDVADARPLGDAVDHAGDGEAVERLTPLVDEKEPVVVAAVGLLKLRQQLEQLRVQGCSGRCAACPPGSAASGSRRCAPRRRPPGRKAPPRASPSGPTAPPPGPWLPGYRPMERVPTRVVDPWPRGSDGSRGSYIESSLAVPCAPAKGRAQHAGGKLVLPRRNGPFLFASLIVFVHFGLGAPGWGTEFAIRRRLRRGLEPTPGAGDRRRTFAGSCSETER